jgi:hypothetical protein
MIGSQSLTNLAMGVPGTAGFAPPEQLQRPQDIDHRTDLFSMGVVLYGLVTGRGPWSGEPISAPTSSEKIWDLIRSSLEEAPIPIKKWTNDVPRRLENVILTLLEKDQAKRIQSAEILEEELKKVRRSLTGEPETGKEFGPFGALGAVTRRFGIHPAVAFGGLAAVLVGAAATLWVLSGNTPTIPFAQFMAAAYADRILEAGFNGDHLEAVLREEGGEVGDVRVSLEGVLVQELARDLRDRGINLRVDGRAGFRALGIEEEGAGPPPGGAGAPGGSGTAAGQNPATGTLVFLDGPDDACSPCAPGQELRLTSGWYTVRASGEEWVLRDLLLRDEQGVFQEEEVDQAEPAIFLPEDASLVLVSVFAPTQTRTRLTEAGTAIAAGDPVGALGMVDQVLTEAPESSWALALRDSVLLFVRGRALAALEAANAQEAGRWLPTCQEIDAGNPDCGRVEEWLEIRRQADRALQGNRLAEAVELADGCLDLSAADADCAGIRQEGRTRLAAAQQQPRDRPVVTPPAPTRADSTPGVRTDQPPPTGVQTPTGSRTDPRAAARTDTAAAARTEPGADSTRANPSTGGAPPPGGAPSQPGNSPALSASDLTIRGYRFAENQFLVDASFSAVGPGGAPLCVASIFGNQDREPFPDTDGELALGGWVAVTEAYTPGTTLGPASVRHVLPVSQLQVDRGTVRVVATTRIWPGSCDAVNPAAPPLAQTFTEAICIVRYPAGWGVCRSD